MTLPPPVLYEPAKHSHILDQCATIHEQCITQDGILVTFHPNADGTMDHQKVLAYWVDYGDQVAAGSRAMFLQFTDDSETHLMGYASLNMPWSETGPMRGNVQKLMVSPKHRYRGVARRLMGMLERFAREKGRWMLTLDTMLGSGAEHMYPKLGYKEIGVVPNYGIHPLTRKLVDEIFFYKDLEHP